MAWMSVFSFFWNGLLLIYLWLESPLCSEKCILSGTQESLGQKAVVLKCFSSSAPRTAHLQIQNTRMHMGQCVGLRSARVSYKGLIQIKARTLSQSSKDIPVTCWCLYFQFYANVFRSNSAYLYGNRNYTSAQSVNLVLFYYSKV